MKHYILLVLILGCAYAAYSTAADIYYDDGTFIQVPDEWVHVEKPACAKRPLSLGGTGKPPWVPCPPNNPHCQTPEPPAFTNCDEMPEHSKCKRQVNLP